MSSNFPPGVTDADIENQIGEPSLLERFEQYLNKQESGKSNMDMLTLGAVYNYRLLVTQKTYSLTPAGINEEPISHFVERAMTWAHAAGYQEAREDALLREPKS